MWFILYIVVSSKIFSNHLPLGYECCAPRMSPGCPYSLTSRSNSLRVVHSEFLLRYSVSHFQESLESRITPKYFESFDNYIKSLLNFEGLHLLLNVISFGLLGFAPNSISLENQFALHRCYHNDL